MLSASAWNADCNCHRLVANVRPPMRGERLQTCGKIKLLVGPHVYTSVWACISRKRHVKSYYISYFQEILFVWVHVLCCVAVTGIALQLKLLRRTGFFFIAFIFHSAHVMASFFCIFCRFHIYCVYLELDIQQCKGNILLRCTMAVDVDHLVSPDQPFST